VGSQGKTDFDTLSEEYNFFSQGLGQAVYEEILGFPLPSTRSALDAGCGTGFLSFKLADYIDHVVGLDLSDTMIALARERQIWHVIRSLKRLPGLLGLTDFVPCGVPSHFS